MSLRVVGWADGYGETWPDKTVGDWPTLTDPEPLISLPAVVEALSDALAGSPVIRHRNLLKLLHELRALKESA